MSTEHIPTTATAVRTVRNGKATITVTLSDGTSRELRGKRAERGAAVIVWHSRYRGGPEMACRADLAAAYTEAQRITTQTEIRTRFGVVPCEPSAWAFVARVTEGEA